MGAQMTKELGVYNEEEKVCTPLGPQRYRLLNSDPRSATLGIIRTPIQIECTPTNTKTVSLADGVTPKELSFVEDIKNENESEHHLDEISDDSIEMEEDLTNVSEKAEAKYLETDIDNVDLPVVVKVQSSASKEDTPLHVLCDVRSPSLQISRTPVMVECTPELFALHSRIDSLSFCDLEVHGDEPSAIVSEDDQTSQFNQSSINDWLANVEQRDPGDTPFNNSHFDSPKSVAKKQKELNVLKKQLFFTPDVPENAKPKVRTPLGDLQTGHLQESPQKLMRVKQWRNIQEERQRRGIPDTENTPPNLPPLLKVSSAPGKMLDRKRNKINWDEDNTMFI